MPVAAAEVFVTRAAAGLDVPALDLSLPVGSLACLAVAAAGWAVAARLIREVDLPA